MRNPDPRSDPLFLVLATLAPLVPAPSLRDLTGIARRLRGGDAALFLAVSTFHIRKSQIVEVDVPPAFFSTLALLWMVRITERPSLRNYLLEGIFTGLAVSTKYTALVLVLPLSVSHLLVLRRAVDGGGGTRGGREWTWIHPASALMAAAVTFFVTSPFVLLDHTTFLRHLSFEREHMR